MPKKQQKRIRFLSAPASLSGRIGEHITINPDIPLPVEIPQGEEELRLEELTPEMIVSGMLIVIAEGKEKREWIDYYRELALAFRPGILGEFTQAAIIKAQNGDYDLAMEILNALRGLFPFSPAVALNRALVLEERASLLERHKNAEAEAAFLEAEGAYTEALALRPVLPDVFFNAGFFYLGRKDFRSAGECFSQYADSGDDDAKKEKAASIIRDIEKSGLDDENYLSACRLIQEGNNEAGMEAVRKFIEKRPAVWNGWFVLGWGLRQMGRWKDGAAAFNKAIEMGGGGSDVHNELAICLMESGDLKGARSELETALRNDPENVKIISNMGVLALKKGSADDAAAFFRTVLELDSEDEIANNFFKQ